MTTRHGAQRAAWRRTAGIFWLTYALLSPLALAYVLFRLFIQGKPLAGWQQKLSGHGPATPKGSTLIHGVSMGEVHLLRHLVPRLEQCFRAPCVVCTGTKTGWQTAGAHLPDHHRRYLPFDTPWAVARFLQETQPARLILMELEIWPVLVLACRERGIPVLVLNARLGDGSFAGYQRARSLLGPVFRSLSLVAAQNSLWGARLRALGCPRVACTGSLKSDLVRVATPAQIAAERLRLGLAHEHRPIFLLASTSDKEEGAVLRSFLAWGKTSWRCIICPRHPERGNELSRLCTELGLRSLCTSDQQHPLAASTDEVLIVDEIGRLGALYGLAELVVVGGSLGSGRHGQNMLESAAAGRCTVVGWDTSNFPDAMALLRSAQAIVEVQPENLDNTLRGLASNAQARKRIGQASRQAWLTDRGASDRLFRLLSQFQREGEPCSS